MKKTLVLGASFKTERYSNLAVHRLLENNYDVVGIGLKEGAIEKVTVYTGMPLLKYTYHYAVSKPEKTSSVL